MAALSAPALRSAPVAIVAAGAVTPFGGDVDSFWSALLTGVDGTSTIERFPVADLRVGRGGEIKKISMPVGAGRPRGRAALLLIAAASDLVARASLGCDPSRLAVVVGTALGGVDELDRALSGDRTFASAEGALYDSPAERLTEMVSCSG